MGREEGQSPVPDWYPLFRAAQILGVAPWDLAERPTWYRDCALMLGAAEAKADKQRQKQQRQMHESRKMSN